MKILLISLSLLASPLLAQEQELCAYIAIQTPCNEYPEWEHYENCATYIDGELTIYSEHLTSVGFGSSELASFWTQNQYFYIRKDGSYLAVIGHDNGADIFQEGLTRSVLDGKIAYFNPAFQMVISPKYDWGWPFSEGRAMVCSGCEIQSPDELGHKSVSGGVWGYIDKQGIEVVPVRYSQSDLRSK